MSQATELLDALMNTVAECIFVVDEETKAIANANAKAIEEIGLPLEELKGLTLDRLFCYKDGSAFSSDRPLAFNSQCLRRLKRNGESVSVNASARLINCDSTNYVLLVVHSFNIEALSACSGGFPSSEQYDFPTIFGRSIKIRDVCRLIGSSAKTDVTVLIQGESGTGKEIIANAVHAHSNRNHGPFVKVNCAALTETLLESELFGHAKGAFTGAIRDRSGRFKQADSGTIFLDEVGSMSLFGQAKLLRVLQEHEFEPVGSSVTVPVDVRVIAATNTDLAKAVTEGKFREDLYYRLNVFQIPLPSLRERKEDISLLAQHFLDHYGKVIGKHIHKFSPETLELLVEHDWPGNVRELENAIEHAVIVEQSDEISPASLPINLRKSHETNRSNSLSLEAGLRDKLTALEKQILIDTLVRANGVKKHAAAMLGIDARNLPYLLRKHHLDEGASPNSKLH